MHLISGLGFTAGSVAGVGSMAPLLAKFVIGAIFVGEFLFRMSLTRPFYKCLSVCNACNFVAVFICLGINSLNFFNHSASLEKLDVLVVSFRLWYMIKVIWDINLTKEKKEDHLYILAITKHQTIQDSLTKAQISNARMDCDLIHMHQILRRLLESRALNDPARMIKNSNSWNIFVPQGMAISFKPSYNRSLSQGLRKSLPKPYRPKKNAIFERPL
ncbi:hypothetical protein DSO57_1006727 [Entomophthora muscae]|uniref:Uncharacterized protein n=1 Tax=Entomophthora muscae TaxID=34485 RepID=A0ACC2USH7_9FUNG|nr:hypothetical protein DSO57_1006727 [Entomophthora muscae]